MKIKEGFILRKVGIQYIVVATGKASEKFDGMMRLNEMGAELFGKLEEGCSKEQLVQYILDNYETEKARAEEDVEKFLCALQEAEAVE